MRERLAVATSLCALGALIFSSQQVIAGCRHGLQLCCQLIIPSLFPFFLLSVLLNKLQIPGRLANILAPLGQRLFHISGCGMSAFFMGLLGGYPLGASYIADLFTEGAVSKEEGEQLLGFCNNSGPAFLIGAIGCGIFHSVKIGLLLYGIHILAAVLTGILLREPSCHNAAVFTAAPPQPFSTAFTAAVRQAVVSVLNVCGYVVCFTILVGLLDADGFFSLLVGRLSHLTGAELHCIRALLTGILELGSGVGQMQGLSCAPINLALAAFLVGWGGISVHYQTMAVIADSKLQGTLHFPGRLITSSIAAVLAYYLSLLFL